MPSTEISLLEHIAGHRWAEKEPGGKQRLTITVKSFFIVCLSLNPTLYFKEYLRAINAVEDGETRIDHSRNLLHFSFEASKLYPTIFKGCLKALVFGSSPVA